MEEQFEESRSQDYGQQQTPPPPQKGWDHGPGAKGYHPGEEPKKGLGKTPIMVLLMVSMLLIAVAGIWTAFAGVPSYELFEDPTEDIDRDDYDSNEDYQEAREDAMEEWRDDQEDFDRGLLRAHKFAGILGFIGLLIGGATSLYAGFGKTELSDKEKTAMLIVAGLFILGIVILINHYMWFSTPLFT